MALEYLICIPSKIDMIDLVKRAEDNNFDYMGTAEGPLLMSDPWQFMAIASQQTSKIKMGPFVTNPSTRIPAETANSIATLNALAPGRVFLGMGAANNAMRSMGRSPAKMSELEHGVNVTAALLRGERVVHDWRGAEREIEMLANPDYGWFNLKDPVETWVAAGGPKSIGVAARTADVLVYCLGPNPNFIKVVRDTLDKELKAAGRKPGDVRLCATTWYYNTQPGEGYEDAILNGFGSGPLSSCITNAQYMADHVDQIGEEMVAQAGKAAASYLEIPPDGATHYLDIWKKYLQGFDPRHKDIITEEIVNYFCLWGDKAQLEEKAAIMHEAGVDIIAPVLSNPMTTARDIDALGDTLVKERVV